MRSPSELSTLLLLSSSSKTPLLTIWTTSYCPTCRIVSPTIESLISSGVGEEDGGVAYAEIEYDAPDMMTSELGMKYMITKVPTLVAFDGEWAIEESRVVDGKKMAEREFLREWVEREAKRRGQGGGGGSGGGGGGWFGAAFGRGG